MYLCPHPFSKKYPLNQKTKNIALSPFSFLYGVITTVRNWLFDINLLKSTTFPIPIISIGNLSVGGTGKTPHTEFILSLLQNEWKTAVLSRGYKRKTKGFYLADKNSNALKLGDEPFQIYRKHPKTIVAVDEKRVHGVCSLQKLVPDLQVVVLDDAYQHRYIHPGLSILLTDYNKLYSRDAMMPLGRLREKSSGSKRADIIIVTKCPEDIRPIDMRLIETELAIEHKQNLFFSAYRYQDIIPVFPKSNTKKRASLSLQKNRMGILLVAGIVSPQAIVTHLHHFTDSVETLFFADHHPFKQRDFNKIIKKLDAISCSEKILLVTEKDAARLISNPHFPEKLKARTYALPIKVEILQNDESLLTQKIIDYVVENSRNC